MAIELGDAPPTAVSSVYGIVAMGPTEVALPLAVLREVIPCPAELIELPASAPGLLGAVDLRGQIIPVLDVRLALGAPTSPATARVVVIVVHDDRVLGLLGDEVVGVTTVDDAEMHPMTAAGGELVFSHSFERAAGGAVVSVLDIAAILRLPGVPVVHEQRRPSGLAPEEATDDGDAAVHDRVAAARADDSSLLVRCGPYRFGLGIEHVFTTLPRMQVRPSPLQGELCRGVVHYSDLEVPVIDPLRLMRMGQLDANDTQGIVVRLAEGLIVLLVSEVIEITRIDPDRVMRLPVFAMRRPELFAGIASIAELGDFFVIDAEALLAEAQLHALAGLNTGDGNVDDLAAGAAYSAISGVDIVLTYSAGVDLASPLEQIDEILPFPAEVCALEEDGDGILGLLTHRDEVVTIVSLPALMGRPEPLDPATSCVLLVRADDVRIGLAVLGLRAIERAVWEEPDDAPAVADPATDRHRALRRAVADRPMVQTVAPGSDLVTMVPKVDLDEIARVVSAAPSR
ncbi:MAG: chemotaxis protein CheW [Actinomycetota bacterium]|nr:chemotaxis protein CheW [Actinomycetota bacterium]